MNLGIDLTNILVRTPHGSWRIAGTRISLDSVVYSFCEGATPEEICQDFSGLSLAQVYATIAYYLNNRGQVDRYLRESQQSAEDLRQDLNTRHSDFVRDLRQRLIVARQSPTLP
jgi:uncharacterized protein (DUF433 family)